MSPRVLPIPFSGPMVNAMLGGRKGMTRRALRPQPPVFTPHVIDIREPTFDEDEGGWGQWETEWHYPSRLPQGEPLREVWRPLRSVRYAVGDILWVREAWRAPASMDRLSPAEIVASALDAGYPRPWCPIEWSADGKRTGSREEWNGEQPGRERRGMHLPRAFSRLTLHVTAVKVERLRDLTEGDAIAEGVSIVAPADKDGTRHFAVPGVEVPFVSSMPTAVKAFAALWEAINGTGSWKADPWVAAYSFRLILGNVDRVLADPPSFGVAA